MRPVLVVIGCCLAAPLAAQNTWIVDVTNAPGTHFTSVAAAFADAQVVDGDLLLVLPGTYGQAATSKALTLLGYPTATLQTNFNSTAPAAALAFANTTGSQPVVLKNLVLRSWANHVALDLQAVAGPVIVENVDATASTWPGNQPLSPLRITGCPVVTLANVRAAGGEQSVAIAGSTVFASGCRFTGQTSSELQNILLGHTQPALVIAQDATVHLAGCSAFGGDGALLPHFGHQPPAPAIRCAGTLSIAADASVTIAAGLEVAGVPAAVAAIECTGGGVRVDPEVVLVPRSSAPPITCAAGRVQLPALVGTGAPPGGVARFDHSSQPGNLGVLILGFPGLPFATPFGLAAFAPGTAIVAGVATVPAAGTASFAQSVPNQAALRGVTIASTGLDIGALVLLANTAVIVLH
jgi:hypothetical protein